MKLPKKIALAWNARFGPVPTPKRWVFIVGCYNSGTTLLHEILATHPSIGSMSWEGQFFTDTLPLPRDHGLPRLWALEPDAFCLSENDGKAIDVTRLKRQWGAQLNDPRKPIIIEKSPTNAGRTRWLQEHFEDAHFIGIIRNGFAVAEGIRRKAKHSLELAARQWRVSNEIMLRDFEHLRHRMVLRYEVLVERPDVVLEQVSNFLQLDVSGFKSENQVWNIHGHTNSIRDMNQQSIAGLSEEDHVLVTRECGELLERFGYLSAANGSRE